MSEADKRRKIPETERKGEIAMIKNNGRKWLVIALVLCLISSLGAFIFQTSFFHVTYHDLTIDAASGHKLDALLLVPENATAQTPAPAIVVSHGWSNNREMQDLNYVEYARRGYVVLAISMYGHGDSEVIPSNTWWDDENNANGLYDGVKYVAELPYVDANQIGVTGHSNGALACREAVLQDREGLIAAALLVSNDAVYYDETGAFYNQFGSRDAAIIACQYDEFFHRVNGSAPRDFINQVTAQSFLNFGIDPAEGEIRTADVFYEQQIDGEIAIRGIFNPAITHPWAHFSASCVSFGVRFFDRALPAPNFIDPDQQIWQWKAAFNALGIAGFFLFAVSAVLVLLDTPFFRELKAAEPVMPWPALEGKAKKRYWRTGIGSAVLSIPFYFIAFILGFLIPSAIWNQGASRVIGIWSLLCGLHTLLTLRRGNKKFPVDKQERGVRIGWAKLGKSVLLALTATCAAFALVYLSDWLLLTDYRLWCFATIRAFSPRHIPMILVFLPLWLVYYVATSVSANCYNYTRMGKSSWVSVLHQMFFVFLGPQIMIMGQYIKFFISGKMVLDPITGIMGIWLFPIVLILPLSVLISNVIYRRTKNPYIGGILMGIVACILTVTNTLTG